MQMQTVRSKPWAVPAFAVLLGVVVLIAFTIGGDVGGGVGALGIMCAYAAVLYFGRRNEAIALLGGNQRDERGRSVESEATAFTGNVLIGLIIGLFLWEIATGRDGEPWSQLGGISGLTFVLATLYFKRKR